jgi:hypothetical protein
MFLPTQISNDPISVRYNDRCFFAGMTGSGKTYLAKKLMKDFPYVICLDNKGKLNIPGFLLVEDFDKLYKASCRSNKIIYRPQAELEAKKSEFRETMDAFYWWIYQRENTICYTDEATSVCDSYNILPGHNALMKRGRELGIGCWNASQQPVNVHNTLISESEQLFMFYLSLEAHRRKLAGTMGDMVIRVNPPKSTHRFLYFNQETMEDTVLHEKI